MVSVVCGIERQPTVSMVLLALNSRSDRLESWLPLPETENISKGIHGLLSLVLRLPQS